MNVNVVSIIIWALFVVNLEVSHAVKPWDYVSTSCFPNPCLNGGICTTVYGRFNCDCPEGIWGEHCEESECTSAPDYCNYRGDCKVKDGEASCDCYDRFNGNYCEVETVEKRSCSENECWCVSAGGSTCNSDSGDVREQEFENSRGTSCLPDECWDREFCSGFNGYWCEGEATCKECIRACVRTNLPQMQDEEETDCGGSCPACKDKTPLENKLMELKLISEELIQEEKRARIQDVIKLKEEVKDHVDSLWEYVEFLTSMLPNHIKWKIESLF